MYSSLYSVNLHDKVNDPALTDEFKRARHVLKAAFPADFLGGDGNRNAILMILAMLHIDPRRRPSAAQLLDSHVIPPSPGRLTTEESLKQLIAHDSPSYVNCSMCGV